jgi:pentatricopeptide repeat protein
MSATSMDENHPKQQQQHGPSGELPKDDGTAEGGRCEPLRSDLPPTSMFSPSDEVQLPPPPLLDLPFDDAVWTAYEESVKEMMERPRVVKKERPDVVMKCREFLLSRRGIPPVPIPQISHPTATTHVKSEEDVAVGQHGSSTSSGDREVFRLSLQGQARRFQQQYNLTSKGHDFVTRCLVYMGDACAGKRESYPIVVAWHKMKEMGMKTRENALSTYMYILSTTTNDRPNRTEAHIETNDGRPPNNGDDDAIPPPAVDNTLLELVTCHDLWYEPNEKTATIRLKGLIARGEIKTAECILASLGEDVKRLRTFMPLMEYYCQRGDGTSILRLFRQMQNSPGVHWDADSYALVLASLARLGHFRGTEGTSILTHRQVRPIDGAREANFSATHGPELFDELVTEMANDILELSESAVMELSRGFRDGYNGTSANDPAGNSMGPRTGSGDVVIQRVEIPSTGICPLTGVKLRLLSLDDSQRQHVHDNLLEMARLQSQQFVSGSQNKVKVVSETETDVNIGYEELSRFSEWLEYVVM